MKAIVPLIVRSCCALACMGFASILYAAQVVNIGVLSFQSKTDTQVQWAPTAHYLQESLPEFKFVTIPLNYEELNVAVQSGSVDFVLTNPEHYVVLRNAFRVSPMLTLNTLVENKEFNRFGSVIFSKASDTRINSPKDVSGKKVAAVGLYSLGGFLIAADLFRQLKIDLRSSDVEALKFTGTPHSQVVQEVMSGKSDVGIVRTGVLEQMARQGKLDLSQVRVLNAQDKLIFPEFLSTALYPEWPWAAMPNTKDSLIKSVALALLKLTPESVAAKKGNYSGFSPPVNYAPVEELMRRLDVYPGVVAKPLWEELWTKYERQVEVAFLIFLFLGMVLLAYFWLSNLRLREMTRLYQESQSGLQVTSAAFNSQVGLIVTDENTCIVRANTAFCTMLGFTEAQLLGKNTAQFRGLSVKTGTINQLWLALQAQGGWQGDLVCRHHSRGDIPCRVTITAIRSEDVGLTGYVGSFVDMSEQKKTELDIRRLAFYDPLTELPNRRLFLERLQSALDGALQNHTLGALMFIDLDHFKILNDTHGHTVGDELLQQISQRISKLVGTQALTARLGGDEFVVMLTDLEFSESHAMDQAMMLAHGVHQSIREPYLLKTYSDKNEFNLNIRYICSGSVGVTLFGQTAEPITEVLKRADVAMYQSKLGGRNTIRQFDHEIQRAQVEKMTLTNDVNAALVEGQLFLHYQLQINAAGIPVGAECLLRWKHPVRGLVSPVEFIPLAEDSGAILAMGEWVLCTACETLAGWAHIPGLSTLSLSVNVSPRQFIEADFVPRLEKILRQTGARPELLTLEITEGIVLQNTEQVIEKMHQLCLLGLSFSIDDFGTGYSSLSYLQRLPLREVKIDKAFVQNLTDNKSSEAIVRAIIALGTSMSITVVSEGVETKDQKEKLIELGCTLLQGFLIAKPMTLTALEQRVLG